MLFVAIVFFYRCYEHVPLGDEVTYQYVWEQDDSEGFFSPDRKFDRKVSSLPEIWQTQKRHYMEANGRFVPHAIEQAFTNHELAFSVVNTLMLLLLFGLVIYESGGREGMNCYPAWLLVIVALLLFFPYSKGLWASVNCGPNYLWSATMAVGAILIWQRLAKGPVSAVWYLPIILFAAVFGWTHEGFVVGVSGGLFLYYCFNFREFNNRILLLALPMWITACLMVFSPGNIHRFFGGDIESAGGGRIFYGIANGIDNILHLKIFLCMLLLIVIVLISRKGDDLVAFLKENKKICYIYAVTFVFTLIANTGPKAHTFVELLSLILIVKYCFQHGYFRNRGIKIASCIVTFLFLGQQLILARDVKVNADTLRKLVDDYKKSDDGLVVYDEPKLSWLSEPYIPTINYDMPLADYYFRTSSILSGNPNKNIVTLPSSDYNAIANPDSFDIAKNKFPGNAPVYKSENGVWLWIDQKSNVDPDSLVAQLKPVDFFHDAGILVRIKFALSSKSYPNESGVEIDTVKTQYGEAYRVKPTGARVITAINTVN